MQNVSNAYKASMEDIGRNRGYIKIELGIVNTEAQERAEIDRERNNLTYFSKETTPFTGEAVDMIYATCEENFSKVDGSMYFLPDEESTADLFNNGAVSNELFGEIIITFGDEEDISYDIIGLTLDFGDCYPTKFIIENDVRSIEYENDLREFVTEDGFRKTTFLRIKALEMLGGEDRLRLYKFTCGVAKTFGNKETKSYTGKEYVSPIAETLPSNDVEVVVFNYDQYYNPDDENSALSFMTQGQELKVSFGYDVTGDGDVEWLPSTVSYLSAWKADDSTATFTAVDRFSSMDSVYYGGTYREEGATLYDIALDVLEDCGMGDESFYYLDSYLKNVTVYNPMPVVKHTEALQIIANAGRCALSEDRRGRIHIESEFVPEMYPSSDNCAKWGSVEHLLEDVPMYAYADASSNYSLLSDNELRFFDDSEEAELLQVGYVSESISNEDGTFDVNPTVVIDFEASYKPSAFSVNFRNTFVKKFNIVLYNDGKEIQTIKAKCDDLVYTYDRVKEPFDKMVFEFIQNDGNQRVHIDSIIIGDKSTYTLTRQRHITGSPTVTREDTIKSISVLRSMYSVEEEQSIVFNESIENETFDDFTRTVYLPTPATNITIEVTNATAEIVKCSSYMVEIQFTEVVGAVDYSLLGNNLYTNEVYYTKNYNDRGIEKTWNNPLISSEEHAIDIEEWISNYFLGDVSYDVDWRGDARVDANDLMHLERRNGQFARVRAIENTLRFNGAWSGRLKTRKVVQ